MDLVPYASVCHLVETVAYELDKIAKRIMMLLVLDDAKFMVDQ